ncbi:MAG: 3D domain-containing protein [Chloroflexota bacterium]
MAIGAIIGLLFWELSRYTDQSIDRIDLVIALNGYADRLLQTKESSSIRSYGGKGFGDDRSSQRSPPAGIIPFQAAATRRPMGVFKVTAYSDSSRFNGTDGLGITKTGTKTRWGTVAVDPAVIPLGSRLAISGFDNMVFEALDTGGGIKGRWIDIWYPTDQEALHHGVQHLPVYIISTP